jgi:hypothetical protein
MPTRNDPLATLEADLHALIDREWKEIAAGAERDASAFLDALRPDLQKWAAQLASGELDREDVEFLIKAKQDLAELKELKRLGLAKVQRDKLVAGVIGLAMKALAKVG